MVVTALQMVLHDYTANYVLLNLITRLILPFTRVQDDMHPCEYKQLHVWLKPYTISFLNHFNDIYLSMRSYNEITMLEITFDKIVLLKFSICILPLENSSPFPLRNVTSIFFLFGLFTKTSEK